MLVELTYDDIWVQILTNWPPTDFIETFLLPNRRSFALLYRAHRSEMVGREEQDSIDAERPLSKFGTARLQIPAVHRLLTSTSAFQLPELSSAAAQCLSFPTQ